MKFATLLLVGATLLDLAFAGPLSRRKFRPKNGRGTRHQRREFTAPVINPRALDQRRRSANATAAGGDCTVATSIDITAPIPNIWHGLTNDEAAAVTGFLMADKQLNLTAAENATEWDNTVLLVELLHPNKSDFLAYEKGGPKPERYAHAVLDYRATEEAYIQDFVVGPIPLVEGVSKVEPLNYPYNKGEGKQRNYNPDEDTRNAWLVSMGMDIVDITQDLWGLQVTEDENTTQITIWGIDPMWRENGRIISWDQFWGARKTEFDVGSLLPLGLYIKSDLTGRDPEKWKVLGWLYNDVFYNSTDAFRAAWSSPGFVKNGPNLDEFWAQTDRGGPEFKNDNIYPPVNALPAGGRVGIDKKENYVEWMGFSFYLAFSRDTGLRLFDVKYDGERILYELGLQEALAHYAGNDPMQSGTAYLDTFYGFGPYAFQLIPGFDCPSYATYLNSTFYVDETTHTHTGSICIFEQDMGYPISRHSNSRYVTATKNIALVARSVCTVGNYDYMGSYIFNLDGSIIVEIRASGYIQSAYFVNNADYGYKIHDNLSGSMHDHVLNFKADFDILGTANSVATSRFVPHTTSYPWSNGKRNTMRLQKGFIDNEDAAALDWPSNSELAISIVNKEHKNKHGEYRGYRIAPTTPPVRLTINDSTNLQKSAEWAKKHIFITRRKETEPSCAHPYNSLDPYSPVVDFSKFVDGESLDQEDLVVWFNLGMHHAPTTSDLPNTVFTVAHAAAIIEPVNYHLENPVKRSKHSVRISYEKGIVKEVQRFGVEPPVCKVDLAKQEPNLWSYQGDVVIRKFPYDPNDWWFQTDSITKV